MNLPKFICGVSVFLLAFTIVCAAQEVIIDKVPMKHVAAYSGEGMSPTTVRCAMGTTEKEMGRRPRP
jgi:hypothetical protein